MSDVQTPWMTLEEAAVHLRSTPEAVKKMVQRGKLPARRFGKRLLFHRVEVDRHLLRGRA